MKRSCCSAARCLSVAIGVLALCGESASLHAAPNEVKITELAPGVYFRKAQTEPKFTGCNQRWQLCDRWSLGADRPVRG